MIRALRLVVFFMALSAAPPLARASFNVHPSIPQDTSLRLELGEDANRLAGVGARYRLDSYIFGFAVSAHYDRVDLGAEHTFNGGSIGGEVSFAPVGFILILLEDKILSRTGGALRRLLEHANVSLPGGVRVGLGHDGDKVRARAVGWVGAELVLRWARPSWPLWPHLTFAMHRQLGHPEPQASTNLLVSIGITRRISPW